MILQIIALTGRGVALLIWTGFFPQCVLFCDSLNHYYECKNSCTAHTWMACLLNVCKYVLWDYQPVNRCSHTVCSWRTSLLNVLACASWGYQQLWRSSYTGCNWKVFSWMGYPVCLEVTSGCAGDFTLFANERTVSWWISMCVLRWLALVQE